MLLFPKATWAHPQTYSWAAWANASLSFSVCAQTDSFSDYVAFRSFSRSSPIFVTTCHFQSVHRQTVFGTTLYFVHFHVAALHLSFHVALSSHCPHSLFPSFHSSQPCPPLRESPSWIIVWPKLLETMALLKNSTMHSILWTQSMLIFHLPTCRKFVLWME